MKKKLAKFLASDKRPEGTMTLPEVYGFLFAVCASPEPVDMEEWLNVVFNNEDPNYKSIEKREKIEVKLLDVFNEVKEQVHQDAPQLPEWLGVLSPAEENYGDEAELAFWCDGFFDGYDWLEEVWDSSVDDELAEAMEDIFATLMCFSHREDAQAYCDKARQTKHLPKKQRAQRVLDGFPKAMANYARIGRTLLEAYENSEPFVRDTKVGRNDPCPCGSGQKYKRCCMA